MDIFLIVLGLIWIITASVQDLKKREVWNWLNFSLIVFGLAYRAFYSVLNNDLWFFVFGVLGLGIFVGLGYLFYYSRIFAGGDAKLMIAMGVILPVSSSLIDNLLLFGVFTVLLLFAGSIYGLGFSLMLAFRNKKAFMHEFRKQLKKYKNYEYLAIAISILLLFLLMSIGDLFLIILPTIVILFPVLFVYGKAIENSCMIKSVSVSSLTEGDWLYEQVKIGKNIIKPDWEGLSSAELKILRKYRGKVKIKQGIPFVPAFLIAFIALILVEKFGYGF